MFHDSLILEEALSMTTSGGAYRAYLAAATRECPLAAGFFHARPDGGTFSQILHNPYALPAIKES